VPGQREPTDEQFRQAIVDFAALLDGIGTFKINRRKERNALFLQGLVFYVHDTARAALLLIDNGHTANAAALARIAVEHATMAQWLYLRPDGAEKYLAELEAQGKTFAAKLVGVGITMPDDLKDAYKRYEQAKAVQEIRQTESLFNAVDPSGWMYVQWKTLCGYVHPSSSTAARYMKEEPDGSITWIKQPDAIPARALLFTLALSMSLATAPLLDLVHSKPYKKRLAKISEAGGVPLWVTEDGGPPNRGWFRPGRRKP